MEKIETEVRYRYSKLFDALKDKLRSETVGKDDSGNLILHTSPADASGAAGPSPEEYYILTPGEFKEYVDKARKNKLLGPFAYRKMMKEAEGAPAPAPTGKIISLESLTLRLSGMRCTTEYEIVTKDGTAEVSQYGIRYKNNGSDRVLERRAVCGADVMLNKVNECRLLSWDGFNGPHPKGVLDGTMFRLKAVVNGGREITAHGSQNFPRRFRDLENWFYEVLKDE